MRLMPARLISLDGRDHILLDLVLIVVGRHPDSDARIDSSRVSRKHCCLAIDRDGVLVRDLNSRNGTRVNGRKIKVGLIRPGDELGIAHLRYRLVMDDITRESIPSHSRLARDADPASHGGDTMLGRAPSDSDVR
jgi:predicted component of type VI protein secretion system